MDERSGGGSFFAGDYGRIIMDDVTVETSPLMGRLMLASLLVLVGGIALLVRRRRATGRFSWPGFVLVMFFAVLLYDLGVWELTGRVESILLAAFHVLQTMSANRDFELPDVVGASEGQMRLLSFYGTLLFIVAPVSIVTAALEFFSGLFTGLAVRAKSLVEESFVFSCLDRRALDLAQDVKACFREEGGPFRKSVCMVFAGCAGTDEGLVADARRMGAFCIEDDVREAARMCSRRLVRSIILLDDDEEAAITAACDIKDELQRRGSLFWTGETRIFVLTDFRNTESLLFPESLGTQGEEADRQDTWPRRRGKVVMRGIDLTRELVEQVTLRYPMFLLSKPRPDASMSTGTELGEYAGVLPDGCWYQADAKAIALARQRDLYERADRHVLVVGAGSVGTEFLSSVLWASRIDGVHTRVDVIDATEDLHRRGRPLVESRYAAEVPEIMAKRRGSGTPHGDAHGLAPDGKPCGEEAYDLGFSLVDAEGASYDSFLEERADTLSYVFVALGDDLLNARVAMRTRRILERKLATRCADRGEFLRASRPLIVAVIRDDEFAVTVRSAANEGRPYDIVCVGNNSDVLTYRMLRDLVGNRATEYKRRSSRASDTHVKYRMFAFARNLLLDRQHVREAFDRGLEQCTVEALCKTLGVGRGDAALKAALASFEGALDEDKIMGLLGEVDWTVDLKGAPDEFDRAKGWAVTLLYQLYCMDGVTRPLASTPSELPSREWLLRMEHDRWNAYMRTQGFVGADLGTTCHIFATGQADDQKHRDNLMGLHPCLVAFEELAELDKPIYQMYQAYFLDLDEREAGMDDASREKRYDKAAESDWLQLLDNKYIGIRRPKY